MALAKDITKYGTTFVDAYHRVNVISADTLAGFTIIVDVYFSEAASDNGEQALDSKTHKLDWVSFVDDGLGGHATYENPIQFAYGLLKTLPEYTGATDV